MAAVRLAGAGWRMSWFRRALAGASLALVVLGIGAPGAGAQEQQAPPAPLPPVFPTAPPSTTTTTAPPEVKGVVVTRPAARTKSTAATTTTSTSTTTTTTIATTVPPVPVPQAVALPPTVRTVGSVPAWVEVLLAVSVAANLAIVGMFLNRRLRT